MPQDGLTQDLTPEQMDRTLAGLGLGPPAAPALVPSAPTVMPGLTEGRIVHFVLPNGPHRGEHRPAIIVKIWDPSQGCVQLQVFTDGAHDGDAYAAGVYWATSVLYEAAGQEPRTWHWIEKA
jgi:hypothetical protein